MSASRGLLALSIAAASGTSVASAAKSFFYRDAADQLEETYWPLFAKLFLEEGKDDDYPMPPSSKVVDLLDGLRDVKGIAVHTDPGTTVTEGQGYAMLAAGMRKDVETLKGLTVGWQANGQGLADSPPCGGCGGNGGQMVSPEDVCSGKVETQCLCKTVEGAYMAGWDMPFTEIGHMGSATDGDSDAVMGLVYLAELTGEREYQEYAAKSIAAFVLEDLGAADPEKNSRRVPATGDIPEKLQTMWLWRGGTCWGGYDTSSGDADDRNLCINPAYFSPGEWRAFATFLRAHPDMVPAPHDAEELAVVLDSAIAWGYNTLKRISCSNGLVSNWWTVPDADWPWNGELKCTNSGTAAGAYYSDAARIPWRVTLDYLWFGDESRTDIYDEDGNSMGMWGAKEYANRWAKGWKDMIEDSSDAKSGAYPPMKKSATPLRPDQVLPLLSNLETCDTVPDGFTASPWNGWGAYPVVTCFQVPLEGVDDDVMQEWVEFLGKVGFDACTNKQYFDLGQEIVVSAMLGGVAWLPLPGGAAAVAPPHAQRPKHHSHHTEPPSNPSTRQTTSRPEMATHSSSHRTWRIPTTSPAPTPAQHAPEPTPAPYAPEPTPYYSGGAEPTASPAPEGIWGPLTYGTYTPQPTPPPPTPAAPVWNPLQSVGSALAHLIGWSEVAPGEQVAPRRRRGSAPGSIFVGIAAVALISTVALAAGRRGRRASSVASPESHLLLCSEGSTVPEEGATE